MYEEIGYDEDNDESISNGHQALQDMKTLQPLQHGGHAYVFKTSENMVLKIFKFPVAAIKGVPPEQFDPYLYFHCEVQAYKRLSASTEGQIPKTKLFFSLTPEQEHELFRSRLKSYQPGKYRRKVGKSAKELPLKAILMEYVEGSRLTREALLPSPRLKSELLKAVSTMHGCGVLWNDVKWRNVIVRGQSDPSDSAELPSMSDDSEGRVRHQGGLVILDFSMARFPLSNEAGDVQTDVGWSMLRPEEWECRRQRELKIVQNMIDHGKLTALQEDFDAQESGKV